MRGVFPCWLGHPPVVAIAVCDWESSQLEFLLSPPWRCIGACPDDLAFVPSSTAHRRCSNRMLATPGYRPMLTAARDKLPPSTRASMRCLDFHLSPPRWCIGDRLAAGLHRFRPLRRALAQRLLPLLPPARSHLRPVGASCVASLFVAGLSVVSFSLFPSLA